MPGVSSSRLSVGQFDDAASLARECLGLLRRLWVVEHEYAVAKLRWGMTLETRVTDATFFGSIHSPTPETLARWQKFKQQDRAEEAAIAARRQAVCDLICGMAEDLMRAGIWPGVDCSSESLDHLMAAWHPRIHASPPERILAATDFLNRLVRKLEIAKEAAVGGNKGPTGAPPDGVSFVAKAIALILDAKMARRPIPQVKQLAHLVGCDRTTLSRNSVFTAARKAAIKAAKIHPGHRTDSGGIEAEDD